MAQNQGARDQGAHGRFVRRSMAAPMLTREREFALARAWREAGDEAALGELTGCYSRLAVSIANKYRHYGLPMSDLVQEALVGLLQAVERFDPDREVRFSTYAAWWIRAAVQDFVLRNWSIVRTGTTGTQKSLFFKLRRLRARIEEKTGRPLDQSGRESIAAELKASLGDVEVMEARLGGPDQSLNMPLAEDGEGEWLDFLVDDAPSPEDLVIGRQVGAKSLRWLREALHALPARERTIIEARRLSEDTVTLEQLGRELGISKERVRQLEQRALLRLREAIAVRVERPADLLFGL